MITRTKERLQRSKSAPSQPVAPHERPAQSVKALSRITACLGAIAIGAVVFAVISVGGAQARLAVVDSKAQSVCVVNRPIEKGEVLTADKLSIQEIPEAFVAEGALGSVEEAVGKQVLTSISTNEQLCINKLVTSDNTSTLASVLEPGMHAISVAVDSETGLAGLVRHNDRVDVLSEGQTLVENARVVAVDSSLNETQQEYATITIQVNPEEAAQIQAAQEVAPVRFAMRSAAESLINPGEAAVAHE